MREGKKREEIERRRRQIKYGISNHSQGSQVDPSIHHAPSNYSLNAKPQELPQQLPQQRVTSYEHGSMQFQPQQHQHSPQQPYQQQIQQPQLLQQQVPKPSHMKYSAPRQNFYKPSDPNQHPAAMVPSPKQVVQTQRAIAPQYQKQAPVIPRQHRISSDTQPVSAHSAASQESFQEQQDNQIATQLFNNHDIKNTGRLTADELQNLLQNDDGSHFCTSSIESLISLFGGSRFGTVNLTEFISLYKRVKKWRKCFVDNDKNGSFTLTMAEFHNALESLSYMIPFEIDEKLFECYAEYFDENKTGKELKFDRFVETLVWLMRLTKVFRKYDLNQEGMATIHYKDFIDVALYLGKFLPH